MRKCGFVSEGEKRLVGSLIIDAYPKIPIEKHSLHPRCGFNVTEKGGQKDIILKKESEQREETTRNPTLIASTGLVEATKIDFSWRGTLTGIDRPLCSCTWKRVKHLKAVPKSNL